MTAQEGQQDATYIKWDRKFEMGIPVIDGQHRKLVALCNGLHAAVMRNRSGDGLRWEESLAAALHECTDYVQTHFHDEEVLMRAAGYGGYERHKREHEAFTRKVLETARGFDAISIGGALQFVRFLYDWILSHVAHEDMLFARPVKEYIMSHAAAQA